MQLIAAASLAAADVCFSYAAPDAPLNYFGNKLKETYDVAIFIPNAEMVGMKITGIEVPMQASAKVNNFSFWTAKTLELETVEGVKVNKVDQRWQVEMPSTGGTKTLRVDIPDGYVIPEGGLYVGYSFTVVTLDETTATTKPVVVASKHGNNGFFLHTSRSYRSWQNFTEEGNATSRIKVFVQGDVADAAVSVLSVGNHYFKPNVENVIPVPVANMGMEEIKSISYKATVGEVSKEADITFKTPIYALFAWEQDVDITLPATSETGDAQTTIEITKVNGKDYHSSASSTCRVLSFLPKKLALMEEYTGCWCGWCPRGFVAMELMNETNPDFVGIAYHDNDQMTMAGGYPEVAGMGFPCANFNRVFLTDPLYADNVTKAVTTPKVYDEYCQGITPVQITAEATIDEDGIVNATTTLNWAAMPFKTNYRIEYVLLADDLHSTEANWNQTNYFSGRSPLDYPGMDEFCALGTYVSDLHFNDVAIATSGFVGVEGSVDEISTEKPTVHTFSFDTNYILNTSGYKIPFDPNKLRIATFLLEENGDYGIVENATKCKVVNLSGINDAIGDKEVETVTCYDLQGRVITNPTPGIHIRLTRFTDGTTLTNKIVR